MKAVHLVVSADHGGCPTAISSRAFEPFDTIKAEANLKMTLLRILASQVMSDGLASILDADAYFLCYLEIVTDRAVEHDSSQSCHSLTSFVADIYQVLTLF